MEIGGYAGDFASKQDPQHGRYLLDKMMVSVSDSAQHAMLMPVESKSIGNNVVCVIIDPASGISSDNKTVFATIESQKCPAGPCPAAAAGLRRSFSAWGQDTMLIVSPVGPLVLEYTQHCGDVEMSRTAKSDHLQGSPGLPCRPSCGRESRHSCKT